MQAEIGQNILAVKSKINDACEAIKKDHNEITLIAVSKKKGQDKSSEQKNEENQQKEVKN